MRTLNIAQIRDLEDEEPVPAFECIVRQLHKQRTGPGNYGPWFVQGVMVEDDEGDKMEVTWTGEDPLEISLDSRVRFEATHTEKHGWKGITRSIREKNGKTYEGVKVTPVAKVLACDPGPPRAVETPKERAQVVAQLRKQVPTVPAAQLDRQHNLMGKVEAVMRDCLRAAQRTKDWFEVNHGERISDAHFQSMAATFFIECSRQGMVDRAVPVSNDDRLCVEQRRREMAIEAETREKGMGQKPIDDEEIPF